MFAMCSANVSSSFRIPSLHTPLASLIFGISVNSTFSGSGTKNPSSSGSVSILVAISV
jgi:hypothetical protein